jgi:hypothetical protein
VYMRSLELFHKIQKSIAHEGTKETSEIKDEAISFVVFDNCVISAG